MKRPSIKSPCVADNWSGPGERIAEVMFPDGTSCLISICTTAGVRSIDVYRASADIAVRADGEEIELEGE
ncbi:hypothetical protein [Roseovarius sp. MMSF_3281]|uniref:hypothetical protein n=1 Tax=Roseovarius sp. MMSF_3281 TaxID=3046694 RepID=UPI00273F5620|nr:hypothetical protein [Roseovarius sp. MMSF_3281]